MQKIIAMLMIGLMLAGCGAQDKQLRLQHINDQKTMTSIKEEMAQMRAERTQGWWNWKLDEKGWGSWITTKTIAITTTAVAVAASLGYLFYKNGALGKDIKTVKTTADASWRKIRNHEDLRDTAHKDPPAQPQVVEGGGGEAGGGAGPAANS